MSGTLKPDKHGEVRVGIPPGFTAEQMAPLWPQMLAKVEEQLGGPAVFVRIQKARGSKDHEFVYRRATE